MSRNRWLRRRRNFPIRWREITGEVGLSYQSRCYVIALAVKLRVRDTSVDTITRPFAMYSDVIRSRSVSARAESPIHAADLFYFSISDPVFVPVTLRNTDKRIILS